MSQTARPPSGTGYIIFARQEDLFAAFYYTASGSSASFPKTIWQNRNGGWTIPQGSISIDQQRLERLSGQFGWQIELCQIKPLGKDIESDHFLGGAWSYCDPYYHAFKMDNSDTTHYLLGASDTQESQRILQRLTELLTPDIHAVPVLLEEEDEQSQTPFRFFWSVHATNLSPTILQAATRVWWQCAKFSDAKGESLNVFLEWPCTIAVPREYWPCFPWGENTRYVLLSRDAPHTLCIQQTLNEPIIRELIEVADLQLHEQRKTKNTMATSSSLSFTVDLRLTEKKAAHSLKGRIAEIKEEIRIKDDILEGLLSQDQERSNRGLHEFPQPLYLYRNTPDGLPEPLRRLLMEWSDQETALRSLLYQKLTGEIGLPGLGPDPYLLTTASALGEGYHTDIGIRLRHYAPSPWEGMSFDLLPEWVEFGLRLFVPHNDHLTLYPALPPSAVAAHKLARALLPEEHRRADWLILLFPDKSARASVLQSERASALQVRVKNGSESLLQPLLSSFDWKCVLDIAAHQLQQADRQQSRTRNKELFLEEVQVMVDQVVENEARERVRLRLAALIAEIDNLVEQLNAGRDRLNQLGEAVSAYEGEVGKLNDLVQALGSKELKVMQREVNAVTAELERIAKLNSKLSQEDRASSWLQSARDRVQRLSRLVAKR